MDKLKCKKCGAKLNHYWIRHGLCNGCIDSASIVTSKPVKKKKQKRIETMSENEYWNGHHNW